MKKSKVYPDYYQYEIPFDPSVGLNAFEDVEPAPTLEDVDRKFKDANCYNRNTKIMAAGVEYPYTQEHLNEIKKCSENIFYFIINYAKVITLKGGIDYLKLYQYQKNAIKIITENRFSIFKFPRQMGKCIDKHTKIKIRINGDIIEITIGQLYEMIETENNVSSFTPNNEYQILTEDGFKDFDGITTRYSDEILQIDLEDNSTIKVTPQHEIKRDGIFVKAESLNVNDNIGFDRINRIKNITHLKGKYEVADMIQVRDTRSFTVNDESAILSNCVDGMSIVTLLDNHTGEMFDIEISELYKFLESGSEDKTEEAKEIISSFVDYISDEEQ